jgi:CheY-like chemotaxis protein
LTFGKTSLEELRSCAFSHSETEQNDGGPGMNASRLSPLASKCRVFLIDDHPIVRQGLALFIDREPDLMVCGEADGAASALQAIRDAVPDFIVLDISLDGPDGLELLKVVRSEYPSLPVLILSMHDESAYAERALRAGANGYIMKQDQADAPAICSRHRPTEGSARELERPGTRSLPLNRRRPWNAPDCRRIACQYKDSRVLSGAHKREVVTSQRSRTCAARD